MEFWARMLNAAPPLFTQQRTQCRTAAWTRFSAGRLHKLIDELIADNNRLGMPVTERYPV